MDSVAREDQNTIAEYEENHSVEDYSFDLYDVSIHKTMRAMGLKEKRKNNIDSSWIR